MVPDDPDLAYLWDMLEASNEAVDMLGDATAEQFQNNKVLCRAIERVIEIIGEAGRRVSTDFQRSHAEIPWREIVGQRNILAHEYGQVDHALLYKTVREDIPRLMETLSRLLPDSE